MKLDKHDLQREVQFSFARSSGPGGQNVNKVNTKAILRWNPDETDLLGEDALQRLKKLAKKWINTDGFIVIDSQEHRTQSLNKEECLSKLITLISKALQKPKKRKKTRPTKSSVEKRLSEKKRKSEIKKNRQEKFR